MAELPSVIGAKPSIAHHFQFNVPEILRLPPVLFLAEGDIQVGALIVVEWVLTAKEDVVAQAFAAKASVEEAATEADRQGKGEHLWGEPTCFLPHCSHAT